MKAIVTGGLGFIGSNLVKRLLNDDVEVVVVDNLTTGSMLNHDVRVDKVYTSIADCCNNLELDDTDVVFHLGFPSASPLYSSNRHLVAGTIDEFNNLLEQMRYYDEHVDDKYKTKLVFASTSSIYADIPGHKEMIHPTVNDYYTECRFACERMAELWSKKFGMNIKALRFFSVYGPRDELKGDFANLVTQAMIANIRGEKFKIYGDGEQRRDFTFVSDIVDAMIAAQDINSNFEIINVGTGKNYSLNEMIQIINEISGVETKLDYDEKKMRTMTGYIKETKADINKMTELLRIKPMSFGEGARIQYEYLKSVIE